MNKPIVNPPLETGLKRFASMRYLKNGSSLTMTFSIFVLCVGLSGCAERPVIRGEANSRNASLEARNQRNEGKSLEFPAAIGAGTVVGAIDPLLKARVESRWKALIDGDVETAYMLMSANSRKLISLSEYRQKTKLGAWKAADAVRAKCDAPDSCVVSVSVTVGFLAKGAGMIQTQSVISESWIYSDSNWSFVRPSGS